MAQLSLKTGTSQALSLEPVEDGALLAPTDKKAIFLDQGNSRKEIKTGHTIQNSSDVNITDRDTLQFMGSGVSVSDDSTNNKTIINITDGVVAPRETSPAAAAHAVGDYIRYSGTVYKVKSAISIGDSLILNTNIEANGLPDYTTIYTPGLDEENFSEEISSIVNVYGSKNLLPNNATTRTINGVTFTVNADGSVTANGTATGGNAILDLVWGPGFKPNSEVNYDGKIFSGCINGSDSTYLLYFECTNDISAVQYYCTLGNGDVIIPSYSYYSNPKIIIYENVTVNNVTFYPMIRDARIKDNTYVPYAMTNRELTDSLENVLIPISIRNTSESKTLDAATVTSIETLNFPKGGLYYVQLHLIIPAGTQGIEMGMWAAYTEPNSNIMVTGESVVVNETLSVNHDKACNGIVNAVVSQQSFNFVVWSSKQVTVNYICRIMKIR